MTSRPDSTGGPDRLDPGRVDGDGRAAPGDRPDDGTVRVGVLSPHNSAETKAICNAVRALGHDPVWVRDENVSFRIEDGSVHGSPPVDVLVNRLLLTKSDQQFEDLQLAALYGETAPVVNPPEAVTDATHKFRAGAILGAAGLPVPDALFGRSPRTLAAWADHVGDRAAHKPTVGTNGQGMRVVDRSDTVTPALTDEQTFVQELLERDGRTYDVRAYVVGDEVVGAMRRYAPEGDWRTNVAVGGEVEGVTDSLGARPRRLAREATATLGLDVAGVDLLPVDGRWHVLEVNATAGFKGLFEATGESVAPHVARLAVQRAGGTVDPDRVAAVAETLDDSVPDCKPARRTTDDATLGYTNRLEVSGRDGVETVVAKADTGAARTSLDTALAGRIGAGPILDTVEVRAGAGADPETRPLVDVDLRLDGRWRSVTASVADRSSMRHPVILGRDLLGDYTLEVGRRVEE